MLSVLFVIFLNLRIYNEKKCDTLKQREIWVESLGKK